MNVYLMQHGEAMSKEQHPDRPLTEEGRAHVEQVAQMLAGVQLDLDAIWHSGKRRAEQTAEIVGEHLQVQQENIRARDDISPNDPVEPILDTLQQQNTAVLIAGHLPFLSRLVGYALVEDPDAAIVRFQNSGVVCLGYEEENWTLDWMIVPSLVQK